MCPRCYLHKDGRSLLWLRVRILGSGWCRFGFGSLAGQAQKAFRSLISHCKFLCQRLCVCVCMCVGGFQQLLPPQRVAAITHIVIEHTRSNAFCLDFIFFFFFCCCCCFSFARHVFGWFACCLRSSHLVLLYAFGFGVVDIKCKTEFHFRQECSSAAAAAAACCCCYWECYNIVEACNILPRIRVGIHPVLSHSLTYSFSCVCACVLCCC